MTLRYVVGIKIRNKADQMTVDAEDALIAALKVKTAHPEAAITYVRKRNARGDQRHPHAGRIGETRHCPPPGGRPGRDRSTKNRGSRSPSAGGGARSARSERRRRSVRNRSASGGEGRAHHS